MYLHLVNTSIAAVLTIAYINSYLFRYLSVIACIVNVPFVSFWNSILLYFSFLVLWIFDYLLRYFLRNLYSRDLRSYRSKWSKPHRSNDLMRVSALSYACNHSLFILSWKYFTEDGTNYWEGLYYTYMTIFLFYSVIR